jgi:hypothetical protein
MQARNQLPGGPFLAGLCLLAVLPELFTGAPALDLEAEYGLL